MGGGGAWGVMVPPIHTMAPPPPPFDFWLCTLHCDAILLAPQDEALAPPFGPQK